MAPVISAVDPPSTPDIADSMLDLDGSGSVDGTSEAPRAKSWKGTEFANESHRRISEGQKRYFATLTPAQREERSKKISMAVREYYGRRETPEEARLRKQHISEALVGRPFHQERKDNISRAKMGRGYNISPESKKRKAELISKKMKGRTLTPQHRENISMALLRTYSDKLGLSPRSSSSAKAHNSAPGQPHLPDQ